MPSLQNILTLHPSFPRSAIARSVASPSTSPVETVDRPDMVSVDIQPFTKADYNKIVSDQRRDFIHHQFGDILEIVFRDLAKRAMRSRNCHYQIKFPIPYHFDIDNTDEQLQKYFHDLGYKTVSEPRDEEENRVIILTLT